MLSHPERRIIADGPRLGGVVLLEAVRSHQDDILRARIRGALQDIFGTFADVWSALARFVV